MSVFGWSYPAGAADDQFAPYNDAGEPFCDFCHWVPEDDYQLLYTCDPPYEGMVWICQECCNEHHHIRM